MRAGEEGFTIVETLIATAIGVAMIVLLALMVSRFVQHASSLDARLQSQTNADHLLERLTSEAAGAWGTYVPTNDVFGRDNSDGHEVDFFSEDGSHRTYQWCYTYNAQTKHLIRYSIAGANAPQQDEDLGAFDTFSATSIAASQLGTVDPLFASSTIPSVTYGYDAAPSALGGNGFVRVRVSASGVNRSDMLASGTAPTTFTVVVTYSPSPAPVATATPLAPVWSMATATP